MRKSAGARRSDLIAQFLRRSLPVCVRRGASRHGAGRTVAADLQRHAEPRRRSASDATVTFSTGASRCSPALLLLATLWWRVSGTGAYPALRDVRDASRERAHRGTASARSVTAFGQSLVIVQFARPDCAADRHRRNPPPDFRYAINEGTAHQPRPGAVDVRSAEPSSGQASWTHGARTGCREVAARRGWPTNYDNDVRQHHRSTGRSGNSSPLPPIDFDFFDFYRVKALAGRLPIASMPARTFSCSMRSVHLPCDRRTSRPCAALGFLSAAAGRSDQLSVSHDS